MCGIVGIVDFRGRAIDPGRVERLLPLLRHRGPDGRGVASSAGGKAVFGHTRLAILGPDSAVAHQPVGISGNLLSFNGEIYNYRDILPLLRNEGRQLVGDTDTETLAHALSAWGVTNTLSKVDGMFGFAWYDGQSQQTYLARDPMGEKPVYWSIRDGRLFFASEIKAILAADGASAAPNLATIDDYLYTAKINGSQTMFRDVQELEPGHYLIVEPNGRTEINKYWVLEDAFVGKSHPANGQRLDSEFERRLSEAVESRSLSDVRLGALLSGGIDSTAIVERLVADDPSLSIPLYFADNRDKAFSELDDVKIFLSYIEEKYGKASLDLRDNEVSFSDYMASVWKLTWNYDEPIQFYNSPLLSELCRIAREDKTKVLLSGEGSDELLYGYDRFVRTRSQLAHVRSSEERRSLLYFGGGTHSVDVVKALTAGVANGAEATETWQWLEKHDDQPIDVLQTIFSQKYRLQTLMQRQDRVGMAHSIEIRVPFLKPTFVSWVNSLPIGEKFDGSSHTTKHILRRVMSGKLPDRLLSKAKDGFPSDMMGWLRGDQMRRLTSDLISDPDGFCQNHLNGAYANEIVSAHFDGRRQLDVLIWNLFSLELWHRWYRYGTCAPDDIGATQFLDTEPVSGALKETLG